MIEGQLVVTYLTTMREYRNQLKKMGVTERYNRTLQEEPSLSDTTPDSLAASGYLPYILSTSSRTIYCTHTSVYHLMKHSGERSPESIGSEPTAQNARHSYQK